LLLFDVELATSTAATETVNCIFAQRFALAGYRTCIYYIMPRSPPPSRSPPSQHIYGHTRIAQNCTEYETKPKKNNKYYIGGRRFQCHRKFGRPVNYIFMFSIIITYTCIVWTVWYEFFSHLKYTSLLVLPL